MSQIESVAKAMMGIKSWIEFDNFEKDEVETEYERW